MTTFARLARNRRLAAIVAIALAAIVFIGVNLATNAWFRTARLDLTGNGLYTVSEGTKNILRGLKEPITLRFFYSGKAAANYPPVHAYAERVRDLLDEYRAIAGDKLIVEQIEPEPYSEDEDRAASLRLQPRQGDQGEMIYFGLSATNMADGQEAVPFFEVEREPFLEYDLTSIIYRLSVSKKARVGIMTGLPLAEGPGGLMAQMNGQGQPYVAYAQLMQLFDLEPIAMDAAAIPADVEALILIHPRALSQETLYALDQFVMRGGHVAAFVDPLSEIMQYATAQSGQPDPTAVRSDLWLLKSWGVAYNSAQVVLDSGNAIPMPVGNGGQTLNYPLYMSLKADPDTGNFNADDIVSRSLRIINLAAAGYLVPGDGATTSFTPLLSSSLMAMPYDAETLAFQNDPRALIGVVRPTGERYTFVARLSGPLKSAFPDGAPKSPPPAEGAAAPPSPPAHIAETSAANLIVVADTDLFDDRFWVQAENQGGAIMAQPFADNFAFVAAAVENMLGSNDLISLRARATADRPFTVVEDLRKEADVRFLREEQDLNARIAEVQEKLAQLQASVPEGADATTVTPAQQAELERFQEELAQTRARLREVQRELSAGIDRLGNWLAAINIALVPVLLVIAAIVIGVMRRRRIAAAQAR